MGNCLPKSRRKNSRVEPVPTEEIHEVLSRATEFKKTSPQDPADMTKALKEEGTKPDDALEAAIAEIAAELVATLKADTNKQTKKTEAESDEADDKKAVAFTVDFGTPQQTKVKVPKRIADRLEAEKVPKGEVEYSCDEELLMAEILREDRLRELKDKAIREDIKVYDAQRRKMALDKSKEAKAEEKARSSTPGVTEQRQKVKDLAEEDRRKAAERRKAASKTE